MASAKSRGSWACWAAIIAEIGGGTGMGVSGGRGARRRAAMRIMSLKSPAPPDIERFAKHLIAIFGKPDAREQCRGPGVGRRGRMFIAVRCTLEASTHRAPYATRGAGIGAQ